MDSKPIHVRDKRNKGYFTIDNEYLNGYARHLGPTASAVYFALCRHADLTTQTCYPTQEQLAEELGFKRRTVIAHIQTLKDYGIIEIERVKKGRKWANNVYYLKNKDCWKAIEKHHVQSGSRERGCTHHVHSDAHITCSEMHTKETQTSIETHKGKGTPAQLTKSFFEKGDIDPSVVEQFKQHVPPDVLKRELQKFTLYWTEPNGSGTKQRWQLQRTFDVKRRLYTWLSKASEWSTQANNKYKAGVV